MSLNVKNSVVLRLNANFMRLGWSTIEQAFCMMMGTAEDGAPPALALDVAYSYDEYGKPITDSYSYMNTVAWEDWLTLEPRRGDLDSVIHTSKRIIRVPTVLVCSHYHQMPKKNLKPSPRAIKERDGNRCQYTGVQLTNQTFSLDHVIPRSKGGKDTWENLVAAHKEFNSKKGDKFNHEIGAKLLKQPRAPKEIPLSNLVKGNYHPDHNHF